MSRYDYSAITNRKSYSWRGGKRLAVFCALNIEHFAFGEEMGSSLGPFPVPAPDHRAYAWHDYGNRVGVWRLLKIFESYRLPATVLANSETYRYCGEILDAFRARGDEIVGHGRTNSERQGGMTETEERELITEATQTMAMHEAAPPRGWLSPYLSQTHNTPDLLKACGYEYMLDWHFDDQPVWFRTASGPLLSMPYATEVNDWPIFAPSPLPAAEFADMIIDTFEEQLNAAQDQPLVYGITLHTFVAGQPFRLRQLRRALAHIAGRADPASLTHPGAIASHVRSLPFGTLPNGPV